MSLAYTLTFLISNVPYVTFELILAFDKQHVLGPTVTAIIGIKKYIHSYFLIVTLDKCFIPINLKGQLKSLKDIEIF